jgi:hypothetical protein
MSFETPLPPFNASDPDATFVNASCIELLMIELVPMAYRVANEVEAAPEAATVQKAGEKESRSGESRMDEEEERDAVFYRLEMLGYRVGQGLVERYAEPFSCGEI